MTAKVSYDKHPNGGLSTWAEADPEKERWAEELVDDEEAIAAGAPGPFEDLPEADEATVALLSRPRGWTGGA